MIFTRRARLVTSLIGAAALVSVACLAVRADDAPKPPATVDGVPITDQDLAIALQDIGSSLPQMTPEQARDYVISYAIDLRIAAAEADKEKVSDPASLQKRLDYYRSKILMEDLLTKVGKDAVTDEAMHKFYDEHVKQIPVEEEVHARHILVDTEDAANKVYDRVTHGEDFAKVAKEVSKDPGSSDGGDLGWFTKDRMVKEFADAAFALKPGEISKPVHSQFGWHVIKLEERRQKAPPSFDQVKAQIENVLVRTAQQDLILKLRTAAKIERAEPPAPVPGAPAPADGTSPTPGAAPAEPPKQ